MLRTRVGVRGVAPTRESTIGLGGKGVASTKATLGRGKTGVSTTGATTVRLGGTGTVQTSRLTHPQLETGVGDLSDEYM